MILNHGSFCFEMKFNYYWILFYSFHFSSHSPYAMFGQKKYISLQKIKRYINFYELLAE